MTTFRLFAGTNIGLRQNNEDNFTVCSDLTQDNWIIPADQQEIIQLGERGCLAVVADGMGGQNAGEVASATAIETVQHFFAPTAMPANVVEKSERIVSYLKKVIVQADLRIKQRSANDPSVSGMGSTIVIAWLLQDKVYVGWMGDSRAYSYIPEKGLSRITKDHSYVQQLVDADILTEEQAMHDPNSNIIMRSLGDASQKAKPDVICHHVSENEVILLCTDGLCGFCSDKEIEQILSQESEDILCCKEKLTQAALDAEGSDNITIALLQIVEVENNEDSKEKVSDNQIWDRVKCFINLRTVILISVILILIVASFFLGGYIANEKQVERKEIKNDSVNSSIEKDPIVNNDSVLANEDNELKKNVIEKKVNLEYPDGQKEQSDDNSQQIKDTSEPTISTEAHSETTPSN